jgi:hypothetical protein
MGGAAVLICSNGFSYFAGLLQMERAEDHGACLRKT